MAITTVTASLVVIASVVAWATHHDVDAPQTRDSVFAKHTHIPTAAESATDVDEVRATARSAAGTASVSGTVVGVDGPISDLDVTLERQGADGSRSESATTHTTAHGHFAFSVSPAPGDQFRIVVPEPPAGHDVAQAVTFSLAKDRRVHRTISLKPTGIVAGTLVDGAGEPVPSVEVSLVGDETMRTTTDANGEFSFTNPPVGAWELRAQYASKTLHFTAGDRLTGLVLRQTPPPVEATTGSLSGSVTATGGERGTVTISVFDLNDGAGAEPIATTHLAADRASYRLADLPPGLYKIAASAEGWIATWFGPGSPATWGEAAIIEVGVGEAIESIAIMLRPAGALPDTHDPLIGDPASPSAGTADVTGDD